MTEMRIDDIQVGTRTRRDMGDLQSLADSMDKLGLLQPIGVSSKGVLVYGQRRLEAAQSLGWESIPVVLIDMANPLHAERDENEERKDFTPSEKVAIAREIEAKQKALYKARNAERLRGNPKGTTFADLNVTLTERSPSRDLAASAVGMAPATYSRAKAVVEAAEADPSLQPVVDAMDKGELPVQTAYRKVTQPDAPVERKPVGQRNRTGLTARVRLERIASQLEDLAEALPGLHTRGEDVEDVIVRIEQGALAVKRAAKSLHREGAVA